MKRQIEQLKKKEEKEDRDKKAEKPGDPAQSPPDSLLGEYVDVTA